MKNPKSLLLACTLVFCSFVGAAMLSIQDLQTMMENSQREKVEAIAARACNEICMELHNAAQAAMAMSSDFFLRRILQSAGLPGQEQADKDLVSYLESARSGLGYSTAYVVSNLDHKFYTDKGYKKTLDPKKDRADSIYAAFLNSGRKFALVVDRNEADHDSLTVFVNSRVEDDNGNLLGICGLGISMASLQSTISRYEKAFQLKISLVNDKGVVQVDTDNRNINSPMSMETVGNLGHGNDFSYQRSESGGHTFSRYIRDLDWYLVIAKAGEEKSVYIYLMVRHVVGFLAVMVVLTLTMYLFLRKDRDQLVRVASMDGLTGLFNKRAFLDRAERLHALASSFPSAFIFLDLDNFKKANDTLGHAIGDRILRDAAAVIREVFRKDDLTGRFGGDEYVIMLVRLPQDILLEKLQSLHEKMRFEYGQGQNRVQVTASIGVVYCECQDGSLEEMMTMADEELYRAKRSGRDKFCLRCVNHD